MLLSLLVFALASTFVSAVQTCLADGTSMQFGNVSNGLQWQSSGKLCTPCNNSTNFPIFISDCYSLSLTSDPTQELDTGFPTSPRQRIEFLTAHAADGTTHKYTWRSYLSSQTGTTNHFFHLMQVFSSGDDGPIITLDAVAGTVAVKDNVRDCTTTGCPSVPLDQFTDRTALHTMTVTYGASGKITYNVADAHTGAALMSYKASGAMGTGGS